MVLSQRYFNPYALIQKGQNDNKISGKEMYS